MTLTALEELQDELNLLRDVEVDKLLINIIGTRENLDVTESLIAGEVQRTIRGASQVTLTIHDQQRVILRNRRLVDEDGDLKALDVLIDGLWFRTVALEKQDDNLLLTLEDRDIARLRAKKGPRKAASRAKVTRAQYILSIVRSIKVHKVPYHIPELRKKQPVKGATKKQKDQARDRRRSKGFDKGTQLEGKDGKILTASELNNASRVLAVGEALGAPTNASLAALVTCIVEAPNFDNPTGGDGTSAGIMQITDGKPGFEKIEDRRDIEKVATRFYKGPAFTGGADGAIALARKHPDWTPGHIAQTIQGSKYPARYDAWRAQAKKILAEWGGTAGKAAVYKTYEYRVEKDETYWDAIQRLAKEVHWVAFFSSGVFYYMSEEDLYASRARFRVSEDTPGVTNINFKQDYRKKIQTATVSCNVNRWDAPPGTVVIVTGCGSADGRYLVETITRNLFSSEATIDLIKPQRERKEPRPEILPQGGGAVVKSGGSTGSFTTNGGAKGIVDQVVTMAQAIGGDGVYVGSDLRVPPEILSGGSLSDHDENNAARAARDIGVRGIDLLVGPPSPKLDKAVVEIGKQFGRHYKLGATIDADNIEWRGYRVQIIWRTPKYGGHMGHVHVGVRRDDVEATRFSTSNHPKGGGTI